MFEPTKATDLYALGGTLICLLTEIRSTEILQLCDRNNPYQIQFQNRLPRLSLSFIGWLEKMVQPLQKDRFPNAKEALAALKPIDVIRVEGVDFSETVLEFKANRLGENLTQSINVENPIADTTVLILLTLGLGATVGTGIIASFLNPFILLALTGTSLPTLSMLLYSPLTTRKLITKYRDSEEYLIKP
jgi:hypothetical protein